MCLNICLVIYLLIMKATWKKYEDKGLSGLSNMGNTCFVNSCFQVLSHTYEVSELIEDGTFTKRLSAHHEKKYAVDCFLLLEYYKLHKLMWEKNCVVSPGSFIKTIHNVAKHKNQELFMGWNQNDVSEFLLFVIDGFHNPKLVLIRGNKYTFNYGNALPYEFYFHNEIKREGKVAFNLFEDGVVRDEVNNTVTFTVPGDSPPKLLYGPQPEGFIPARTGEIAIEDKVTL